MTLTTNDILALVIILYFVHMTSYMMVLSFLRHREMKLRKKMLDGFIGMLEEKLKTEQNFQDIVEQFRKENNGE